jgi:cytochrome c oxidase subunit IV
MKDQRTSPKFYFQVYGALFVLLILTVLVSRLHLGPFNIVAALAIAFIKTLLIILYFMHVRQATRLTWIFASAGFIWLVMMIALTMSDYLSRGR